MTVSRATRRVRLSGRPAGVERPGEEGWHRRPEQHILDHLGLATVAPSFRAPPDPPDGSAGDPPREWSYEPFFDDLPIPDPVLM